jgi:hypothetical protein
MELRGPPEVRCRADLAENNRKAETVKEARRADEAVSSTTRRSLDQAGVAW